MIGELDNHVVRLSDRIFLGRWIKSFCHPKQKKGGKALISGQELARFCTYRILLCKNDIVDQFGYTYIDCFFFGGQYIYWLLRKRLGIKFCLHKDKRVGHVEKKEGCFPSSSQESILQAPLLGVQPNLLLPIPKSQNTTIFVGFRYPESQTCVMGLFCFCVFVFVFISLEAIASCTTTLSIDLKTPVSYRHHVINLWAGDVYICAEMKIYWSCTSR